MVGKVQDRDYKNELIDLISQKGITSSVYFYGLRNDVQGIINKCDICIVSSVEEGLPLSLLEYGMCNKPVISTNVGDCDKLIKDGVSGILINKKNQIEMSEAMLELLRDDFKQRSYASSLNKIIEDRYSFKKVREQLKSIYNSIL